jgi:hypothetical protein
MCGRPSPRKGILVLMGSVGCRHDGMDGPAFPDRRMIATSFFGHQLGGRAL